MFSRPAAHAAYTPSNTRLTPCRTNGSDHTRLTTPQHTRLTHKRTHGSHPAAHAARTPPHTAHTLPHARLTTRSTRATRGLHPPHTQLAPCQTRGSHPITHAARTPHTRLAPRRKHATRTPLHWHTLPTIPQHRACGPAPRHLQLKLVWDYWCDG